MNKFVKGDTSEEKFNSIERTLKHFSRRLHKTVAALILPVPIGCQWDILPEDGVVLRFMFPSGGEIAKAVVAIGDKGDKKMVPIEATITSTIGTVGRTLEVKRQLNVTELNVPVKTGDRLTVTIKDQPEIKDVWIVLLWRPNVTDVEVRQLLIDVVNDQEDRHAREIREEAQGQGQKKVS